MKSLLLIYISLCFTLNSFTQSVKNYYDNGNLRETGDCVNGIKKGYWKYYNEFGYLINEGNYKKGLKVGLWKKYYETGELFSEIQFSKGRYNGLCKLFYLDKKISCIGKLNGFLPNSINYENNFHKTENLDLKKQFNGIRIGEWKEYHENDSLWSNKTFSKKGKPINTFTSYYDNGKINSVETYKKGKLDGVFIEYERNGNIEIERNYNKGLRNGTEKIYYDGILFQISFFKNNELHGELIEYYKNGGIREKTYFKNGKMSGKYERYSSDSIIIQTGIYKNDKREGNWKNYSINGELVSSVFYKDDKIHGWKKNVFRSTADYNYDGHLNYWEEGMYILDEKDGEWNRFSKGEQKLIEHYKNGIKEGIYLKYIGKNKQLIDSVNFVNGKMDGKRKQYFSDGKLMATENYNKGVKAGLFIKYHDKTRTIKDSIFYINGKKHGTCISSNSYWKTVEHYNLGKREGISQTYYIRYISLGISIKYNGLAHSEYFENDKLHGEQRNFYDNGVLESILHFSHGQLDGDFTKFNFDGSIKTIETYKKGKLISSSVKRFEDEIIQNTDKKNNVTTLRKRTYYYANGKVKSITNYKNDTIDGPYVKYNRKGIIAQEGNYSKKKKQGIWKTYRYDGQIKHIEKFKEGKLEEKKLTYSILDRSDSVKLYRSISYVEGQKHGLTKFFRGNGDTYDVKRYYFGYDSIGFWSDWEILNQKAWDFYEQTDEIISPKEAISFIKKSIKLNRNYYNTDTYSAVLYRIGNYEKAIKMAKESYRMIKFIEYGNKAWAKKMTSKLLNKIIKKININKGDVFPLENTYCK